VQITASFGLKSRGVVVIMSGSPYSSEAFSLVSNLTAFFSIYSWDDSEINKRIQAGLMQDTA